ncbi:MAG: transposase [Rhodospirillaceae bacterium]|nr:transposase [Rhodospirillaceae bacterium]
MTNVSYNVAGIDIAKASADVCLLRDGSAHSASFADPRSLCRELAARKVTLAVVEPTGGYERPVIAALDEVGIPVAVVNARLIRDFARASGLLAKTDRLDARVLAEYAHRMRPEPRPRKTPARQRLSALVRRRRQLVGMRKAERTRRQQTQELDLLEDIQNAIAFLTSEIKAVEKRIQCHIDEHGELSTAAGLMRSMPGIGAVAAASLLAELPELGILSRRKIAALVGLAPFSRDSGSFRGRRTVWGGRADLRSTLHMGVISAIRADTQFKHIYTAMRERGKPHKVATTAILRKMIVQLNAMLRDQTTYSQQHSC